MNLESIQSDSAGPQKGTVAKLKEKAKKYLKNMKKLPRKMLGSLTIQKASDTGSSSDAAKSPATTANICKSSCDEDQ